MTRRNLLYGLPSLLSLLGLIGIFTPERQYLAFLAFLADIPAFFTPCDEMYAAYVNDLQDKPGGMKE